MIQLQSEVDTRRSGRQQRCKIVEKSNFTLFKRFGQADGFRLMWVLPSASTVRLIKYSEADDMFFCIDLKTKTLRMKL